MKQEDGVGQTRENSKHKQRHMAQDMLKQQGELTKPSMRTLSRVTPHHVHEEVNGLSFSISSGVFSFQVTTD